MAVRVQVPPSAPNYQKAPVKGAFFYSWNAGAAGDAAGSSRFWALVTTERVLLGGARIGLGPIAA